MAGAAAGRLIAGVMAAQRAGAVEAARASLLELGGPPAATLAARIEALGSVPAFSVMAAGSRAARPQWAGILDDLFDRPLLTSARAGLRNAFASTLAGDTLYRNAFFSFTDAVVLWHFGHTQDRRGGARIDLIYTTMLRLLQGGDGFLEVAPGDAPDVAYFHRLRRVGLTHGRAYPLLRRAARLAGAVEAEVTQQKVHPVRGSLLTSYISFSAQVLGMARALRSTRRALDESDVRAGLDAVAILIQTPPAQLERPSGAASRRAE